MVTRKPLQQATTVDTGASGASTARDMRQDLWSATESGASADRVWAEERREQMDGRTPRTVPPEDVPNALRPGLPAPANYSSLETEENVWGESPSLPSPATGETDQGARKDVTRVPTVLRPGGGAIRSETNPFKRKPPPASQTLKSEAPAQPPTSSFAQLTVEDTAANPWGQSVEESNLAPTRPPMPTILEPDTDNAIWNSAKPSRQPTPGPPSAPPTSVSMPSESGSAVWDEHPPMRPPAPEEKIAVDDEQRELESHMWDDLGALDKGKGRANEPPAIPSQAAVGRIDEWSLIDLDQPPRPAMSRADTWENFGETLDAADTSTPAQDTSQAEAPSALLHMSVDQTPVPPVAAQPARHVAEPKNETYQIKVIRWQDVEAAKNPRESPILVQNENGPCPLVALVNALTLTTPADVLTPLVDMLRTREQISLSLVIDAVFDELMSSRRTNPSSPLPDVTELYKFLKGLHTGMNVNPRFIPTGDRIKAFKRTSLTHLHPTERNDTIPGTFEDTTEMRLYSTFSIPLIHGWLPPKSDPVYDALARRAGSYEDVQNLLFMEEELEDKLSSPDHQGLTEEEQAVYRDLLTIKSFLGCSATQLTPYGLQTIRQAMKPGSIAILFRNDHFTTLYRHPQTHELLTLVTDAGYASHEEVVWESLVDVNGENAEFFSGDFRVVGGAGHHFDSSSRQARDTSPSADTGEWTTVQGGRRGRTQTHNPSIPGDQPPLSPAHEQEDRDLALAMQLQEEEDERARAEQARRRRESLLSEQFIEQQGRQNATSGSGRGSNLQTLGNRGNNQRDNSRRNSNAITTPANASTTSVNSRGSAGRGVGRTAPSTQTVRSLIPPRGGTAVNRPADDGEDEAPPSYEQAAKQAPYVPQSSTVSVGGPSTSEAQRRTSNAAAASLQRPSALSPANPPGQSTSGYPGAYPGSSGSGARTPVTPTGQRVPVRQGVPMGTAAGRDRGDRDCVVM